MKSGDFKPWLLAARPKTLLAAFAPVLMGCAMALQDGVFHAPSALAALLGAICIQIGTNFWNDYADFKQGADTEERQGPTRAVAAGLISPTAMRNATILVFGLAVLISGYLYLRVGWIILAIGAVSIACGIWYTAGRWSLAYLGIGDLFVVLFFGPVAVGGTYFVQAEMLDASILFFGLAPGLIATGLLAVNNLRDIEQDRAADKKTPAVRFGRGFVRAEYLLCILLPCALPAIGHYGLSYYKPGILLAALILIPALPVMKTVLTREAGKELNPALGRTAMLLMLYSVLFSIGVNL